MDPDALLAEIRRIVGRERSGSSTSGDFQRLVDLIHSLDEWIIGDGNLPRAWRTVVFKSQH